MSLFTDAFGLSYFGGGVPGSLADDGAKFTSDDPRTVDAVLKALMDHQHATFTPTQTPPARSRLEDPLGTPVGTINPSGGALPAGRTYHYVLTFLDPDGLETGISDEVAVDTPDQLVEPTAPSLITSTGGTLKVGGYSYALTYDTGGSETRLGPPALITTTAEERTVTVTVPALGTADAIMVWRRGPGESGYSRVQVQATTDDWVDDGTTPPEPCPTDPSNLPPSTNQTRATTAITITVGAEDAAVLASGAAGWRLYRSETSGSYPGSSLVAQVVERTDDVLVNTVTDTGGVLLAGSPPARSQTLTSPQPVIVPGVTVGTLPVTFTDGDLAASPVDLTFSYAVAGQWWSLRPELAPQLTVDRPPAPGLTGRSMFDLTLGRPVWSNGTDWVDATGTVV